MGWAGLKRWLEALSGLHMDALHVYAGVLLMLVAAFALRRPLRSPLPWLVVLVLALANEAYDLWIDPWPQIERARQWHESLRDLLNTIALPGLILVLARHAPRLFACPALSEGAERTEP